MSHFHSHLKKAFTLVEILVVIAIIAILAAILFPVFSRARESGRTAVCSSNLKQIGLAFAQYVQDHNGAYPIAGGYIKWDDPSGQKSWMQQLYPYTKSQQIYKCPTDNYSNGGIDSKYSYFMSGRAAFLASSGSPDKQESTDTFAATHEIRIEYPSQFVTAGDCDSSIFNPADDADKDDYSNDLVGQGGPPETPKAFDSRRHLGGQNLLFADGHIKKIVNFDPKTFTFRYRSITGWAAP